MLTYLGATCSHTEPGSNPWSREQKLPGGIWLWLGKDISRLWDFIPLRRKAKKHHPWLDAVTRLPCQMLVAQVPLAAGSARAGRSVVIDGGVHQRRRQAAWEWLLSLARRGLWGLESWPHLLAGFPDPPSRGRCCLLMFGKELEEEGAKRLGTTFQDCGEASELGIVARRLFPSSFPGAPGLPLLAEEELLWAGGGGWGDGSPPHSSSFLRGPPRLLFPGLRVVSGLGLLVPVPGTGLESTCLWLRRSKMKL